MAWLTVREAAQRLNRSHQWVRDRIYDGTVPGYEQPAGSRVRLLIAEEDLDRLAHRLRIEPRTRDPRPPPAGIAQGDTVDSALIAGLMAENEHLKRELQRLKADNSDLLEIARIALNRYDAALETENAIES